MAWKKSRATLCSRLGLWLSVHLPLTSALLVSSQFFQQCLGLLQVFGIKPFGEPAVDLGQQLAGFVLLVLTPPQSTQTHHRSQLQRLGTLVARNLDGLEKTRFGFFFNFGPGTLALALKRQFAFQPIQLRLVDTLPSFVHVSQRLSQQSKSFFGLPHFPIRRGQLSKMSC